MRTVTLALDWGIPCLSDMFVNLVCVPALWSGYEKFVVKDTPSPTADALRAFRNNTLSQVVNTNAGEPHRANGWHASYEVQVFPLSGVIASFCDAKSYWEVSVASQMAYTIGAQGRARP